MFPINLISAVLSRFENTWHLELKQPPTPTCGFDLGQNSSFFFFFLLLNIYIHPQKLFLLQSHAHETCWALGMSHITAQTCQLENHCTANWIYSPPCELHSHGLEIGRWFSSPEAHGWFRKQEELMDLLELSLDRPSSPGWMILARTLPMLTNICLALAGIAVSTSLLAKSCHCWISRCLCI